MKYFLLSMLFGLLLVAVVFGALIEYKFLMRFLRYAMKKGTTEIIERWTRLAAEAKELGLATIPIDPENMLMVLGSCRPVRLKSQPIARMTIRLRSTSCATELLANSMVVFALITTP
jgi:hypothetical protein